MRFKFDRIESFEKPQIQNSLRRTQRTSSSLIHSKSLILKSLKVISFGNRGYSKSSIDCQSLNKTLLIISLVHFLLLIINMFFSFIQCFIPVPMVSYGNVYKEFNKEKIYFYFLFKNFIILYYIY